MNSPIRVGAVSYLNAKPLYHDLCAYAPEVSLSMDLPSRLADRLAEGAMDVALIPSIEYLRGVDRGYEIIPGFAIAAHGPVRSVKLFSRVPWDRVERLALDAGSRTSQALARIWLDERHRCPACGRRRVADGGLGPREHGGRGLADRRPGDEGFRMSLSTRWWTWPRPGRR